MNKFFIFFLTVLTIVSCEMTTSRGFRFSLFKGTPAENLAYAVQDEDTDEIERILKRGTVDVDYQESSFGSTLLTLAVSHDLKKSTKKLLEFGADPNAKDHVGYTPLMTACDHVNSPTCDITILKMLLDHGGNVNAVWINKPGNEHMDQTLLMIAVSSGLPKPCNEKAKLLVERGADIDAIVHDSTWCAVNAALMLDNLEAAKYLLIERNARIPTYALIRFKGKQDEEKVTVRQLLDEQDYSDDPYRDKIKKELLEFLTSKGY